MSVACVLLAAGSSRRMEGANKLLLDLGGRTVARECARQVGLARFAERVAVTGHESEHVRAELEAEGLSVVHNPAHEAGMHASIRVGVSALRARHRFLAICLADQPALSAEDHDFLIGFAQTFAEADGPRLIAPYYRGARGHPVLIHQAYVPEILAEPDSDQGCRYLFDRHPEAIVGVEMPTASILIDVDTRAAFEAFRESRLSAGTPAPLQRKESSWTSPTKDS